MGEYCGISGISPDSSNWEKIDVQLVRPRTGFVFCLLTGLLVAVSPSLRFFRCASVSTTVAVVRVDVIDPFFAATRVRRFETLLSGSPAADTDAGAGARFFMTMRFFTVASGTITFPLLGEIHSDKGYKPADELERSMWP